MEEAAKGFKLSLWPFLIIQVIIAIITVCLFSSYDAFLDSSAAWWILSVLFVITVTPRLTDSGMPQIVSFLFALSAAIVLWCLRIDIIMVLSYSFSIWGFAAMLPKNFLQQVGAF